MGRYYCFGCQASGDAITFVREVEHLDFVDAVERLAARAGITLRYDDKAVAKDRTQEAAAQRSGRAPRSTFYHRLLLESPDGGLARRVPRGRAGSTATRCASSSSAGRPTRGTGSACTCSRQKFARDDIVDAGLAFVNKVNKLQDQFRARLHVPDLRQSRAKPAGFGGRALGGDGPKYKNSPETPIYQKSRLLYGLNWAKGEIVGAGRGRHLRGLHRRDGVRARRCAERGRHVRHRARRRPLPDPEEPRPQGGARLRLRRRRPGRGREVVRVGAALRDPARRSPTCPPGATPPTCGTTTRSSSLQARRAGDAVPAVPARPRARRRRPRHARGAGPRGRGRVPRSSPSTRATSCATST